MCCFVATTNDDVSIALFLSMLVGNVESMEEKMKKSPLASQGKKAPLKKVRKYGLKYFSWRL